MILLLIGVALAALTVSLLLSPFEVLGWWAGWYGEGLEHPHEESQAAYAEFGEHEAPDQFVIFLDGIANVGAGNYHDVEALLAGLAAACPRAVILGDVMPYSVLDVDLLSPVRPLAPFWRRMFNRKVEGRGGPMDFTINLRNLFQVMVAADQRYGSVFGRGEAQLMLNSLLARGYSAGSGTPITIIGYSGGAQIGLAAVPFLNRSLGAPLSMVSLGGVMASEAGLDYLDVMYHLEGSSDWVPKWGRALVPGLWRISRGSHWNRLRRSGRIKWIEMGPMHHNGPGSYIDVDSYLDGESHLTITTRTIGDLLDHIAGLYDSARHDPA